MTLTVSRVPWLSPTLRAIFAAVGMTATVACGGGGVTRGFVGTTTDTPEAPAPVDPSSGIPGDDLPSSPPLTPIGAPAPTPAPAPPPTPPPPAPPPAPPAPVASSTVVEIPDLTASPGTTPGQVVLRFTAPSPQAQAYVVRASERTVENDADAARAPTVAHNVTPGTPGAPQTITLSGLEEGQTLSFTVQAIRAGVSAPFGLAVSSRVPEGPITAPANAIRISAPGTLAQNGATYLLTQDVSAAGTAFQITGRDVVLDLGGHTVTYGTAAGDGAMGVRSEYLYGSGKITVRNGRIVQGAGDGKSCPAIGFRGGHEIRLHRLELVVQGPDCNCIEVTERPSGELEIDHNVLRCDTKVVTSRHYPGVAAMYVADVLQSVRIHHNKVLSSPQWGIKLQGLETHGVALVHHNQVKGTKALVANGYMIGVYKPDAEVYENELAGESRGIHVDGIDGSGNRAYVHDNSISVKDQPNPEYPDFHWVHGIKLEGPDAVRIERNLVVGVADDQHAEVRALDVDLSRGKNTKILDNRFTAIARTTKFRGIAFQLTGGSQDDTPIDAAIRRNVFTATDRTIVRSWGSATGGVMDANAFVRDLTLGSGQPFAFEVFETSDARPSLGHRICDAITTESTRAVTQWIAPAAYSSTREWTMTLLVVDGAGRPVDGAGVAVRDRQGTVAFTATTDAAGVASGMVVETIVRNGPIFDGRGPFTVSVTKAGLGTTDGAVAVAGRTAVRVDLGAKSLRVDTTAPAAPTMELARPVAASRALVRWSVPSDASGISAYQVFLDGALVAVAEEPRAALAGLVPGTTYVLTVKAIDRGGNVSAASSPVSILMGSDDRGF